VLDLVPKLDQEMQILDRAGWKRAFRVAKAMVKLPVAILAVLGLLRGPVRLAITTVDAFAMEPSVEEVGPGNYARYDE